MSLLVFLILHDFHLLSCFPSGKHALAADLLRHRVRQEQQEEVNHGLEQSYRRGEAIVRGAQESDVIYIGIQLSRPSIISSKERFI